MDENRKPKSRAEYHRKYYSEHPEKQKEWNARYLQNKFERMYQEKLKAESESAEPVLVE